MNALLSAQYLQNWPITIFKTYTHRFHAKAQVNFKNLIKQRYPAKVWIIWRSSLINQSRVFKLIELWLQKKWSQFMFYIAWHFCCQIISIKDSWSKKCLDIIVVKPLKSLSINLYNANTTGRLSRHLIISKISGYRLIFLISGFARYSWYY